jgi:hypothetical protein
MERNLDLVRRIMLEIQSISPGETKSTFACEGEYKQAIVYEHLRLLHKEGFIEGNITPDRSRIGAVSISALTWKGHDFISASQDDHIWEQTKSLIIEPKMSFTFDILLEWLKKASRSQLGLS